MQSNTDTRHSNATRVHVSCEDRNVMEELQINVQWPLLLTWFNFNLSMDK